MPRRVLFACLTAFVAASLISLHPESAVSAGKEPAFPPGLDISPMGKIARGDEPIPQVVMPLVTPRMRSLASMRLSAGTSDILVNAPNAPDYQTETTIAKNGDWIVVGYNDYRGFAFSPPRVSGYAYSLDGGINWTDGGQMPSLGAGDAIYGDPDVKTWTDGSNTRYFVYSSIYITGSGNSSLCVFVSTDGGATWAGPREVTSATSATNFADKEFIDIDPETGRLFISWTNFPPAGSVTMRVSYSDDLGLTWSPVSVLTSSGQGSVPRADGNSSNVYLAWTTGSSIMFSRSTNNGANWSIPLAIASGLSSPMNPYGVDRIGNSPSMAIEPVSDTIFITYASRNLPPDFGDIYIMSSGDNGGTFSTPMAINASPGNDRAQFYPWVCTDASTGGVNVMWYDQRAGIGSSDLTELVHTHSLNDGATWTCPAALSDAPFHAEAGNTTSQPNLGDYIQCVSDGGTLYSAFGKTDLRSWTTYSPDAYVDISPGTGEGPAPLVINSYALVDTGCTTANGFIEPGETIGLTLELRNTGDCGGTGNVFATLTTTTPGITITTDQATFPGLPSLNSTSQNSPAFEFTVDPGVPCGTVIDFVIDYVTDFFGPGSLPFEGVLRVGHPVATVLLSENFDGVTAPALPAGWMTNTLAGAVNPWVTSTTFAPSGPNAAFCADIGNTSLNELRSPMLAIPAGTDIVRVELDETHNMEINTERQAWDGGLMRIQIGGGTRYLSGAIGDMQPFYQWQMLRQQSSDQPLQDLACWSDNITPLQSHCQLDLPDLGGESINVLFDVSTDTSVGTATGLFIDNVVVTAIDYQCACGDPTAVAGARPRFDRVTVTPNPFNPETAIRFTLPASTTVTAAIYSVDGRRVRTLADTRRFPAGAVEMRWNGRDDGGAPVASGVYFVRVKSPLGSHTARAVLLK
ncbi:MAG TPA: FlgD immunoglobulin-like domain containing protein [Candidatus Krumholzibacteria bacterium]|nr:FlgD immunoglobulin-like domain containing protein [Candidatus Krumholzibacteria bacterium]